MLRLMVPLFCICLCANAQFFGLATPADGSRVYFATPLRQKNTTQPPYGKLFQVDSLGLQPVLSRDKFVPPPPTSITQAVQTNAYDLFAASVSADGNVFAAAAARSCAFGDCQYVRLEDYTTTVTAAGQQKDYPGKLQLSANGEWAFGGSSFGYFTHPAYLFHVTTGEQINLGIPSRDGQDLRIAGTGRAVADDGTVVYSAWSAVVLIHAGEMRRISLGNGRPQSAVLDRSARTVVFSVCGSATPPSTTCNYSIRLADTSGTDSSLLISDGYAPSLSDDGRTLLYLSNRSGKPQARIFSFNGFADRQLTNDPAGIAEAVLSGDGSTVCAVTLGGQLLTISVATGSVRELITRTPYLTQNGPFFAPGKLTNLPGVGLTDLSVTAAPPLQESLNGIQVTIQGRAARIQSVSPNAITVLVPPDVVPSANRMVTSPVNITLTSRSPFDAPHADVYIAQYAPEFFLVPGFILLAAHEDWSDVVSAGSPARPGEVIHAYAVGLGDTSPVVTYGQAAPASEPLARLTIPISCGNSNDTKSPVDVLFQGLAPNLAGIYQIDLRVPSPLPDGNFGLYCVWGGIGSGGPSLGGRIPVQSSPMP